MRRRTLCIAVATAVLYIATSAAFAEGRQKEKAVIDEVKAFEDKLIAVSGNGHHEAERQAPAVVR